MERLVKVGINAKGGFNYQVVLDSEEDIKCLIRLYKALEKGGLIPKNSILKEEWGAEHNKEYYVLSIMSVEEIK